jgi:hypothetical protein
MPRYTKAAAALPASIMLVSVLPSAGLSGAWVQKKGGYYLKLTAAHIYTTEEFDSAGNLRPIREGEPGIGNTSYRELYLFGYLEYGVAKRLTLVANLPFKIATSRRTELPGPGSPMRSVEVVTGGLSDLNVSARVLLFGTSAPVSVQAGAILPLGYDPSPPGQGAPLGSGKVDFEGLLLSGVSLWPIRAYLTGHAGYRIRGGSEFADQYLYQVEGGVTPGPWFAKVTLEGIYSARKGAGGGSATIATTNQDVLKLIPTIAYRFDHRFALGAELIHTVSGKNTVAGTTYSVEVVFRN